MRKKRVIKKRSIPSIVDRLTNYVMWDGEKRIAKKIVLSALELVEKESKTKGLEILNKAVENVRPKLKLKKSKRIGGTVRQIPDEVKSEEGIKIALKRIVKAARSATKKKSRKGLGKSMAYCLYQEIFNNAKEEPTGVAYKVTENEYKQAKANFVFLHNLSNKKIFS